jgi:NodT family efflux transporter outer membrane factor (OMF) lipoprotein
MRFSSQFLRSSARLLGLALVVALANGCAVKKPPASNEVVQDALPETTEIPADWAAGAEDTGYVDDGWVASFGDTRLGRLVDESIQNNLDLRLAASQVERAAGLAQLAGSSLKPTIGIGGDAGGRAAGREVMDTNLFSGWTYGASLTMSWELDVWGKLRARAQAGEEALAATAADFEYARQSIAATTTKTYFLATAARQQLALAEEAVELFKEIVEIVEARQEVGQVSQQDVYLAGADLASAQEARELAQSGYEQVQRALEVLLGRYPSAAIEGADMLGLVPPPIPVGVPSDIIARRPDLIAAERKVAAAFLLTEEARLAKLPSFNLTAGGGYNSLTESIASLSAGVFAPLYTGGALEAQLDVATADQEAAIAVYGRTLLSAFQQVENALSNERLFENREGFLKIAVDDNAGALEIAKTQFDVGRIDLLSVLQIQARLIGSRSAFIGIRNERLAQRVNLHLALGGSFE